MIENINLKQKKHFVFPYITAASPYRVGKIYSKLFRDWFNFFETKEKYPIKCLFFRIFKNKFELTFHLNFAYYCFFLILLLLLLLFVDVRYRNIL